MTSEHELVSPVICALEDLGHEILAVLTNKEGWFQIQVSGRPMGVTTHPDVWEHALYLHEHGDKEALANCL